jgi:hypothetical protein
MTSLLSIKHLTIGKVPRLDQIPNTILKQMPPQFHSLLFLFFTHCYKQHKIPASWKTSLTILLYKKGNPTHLTNHKSIALANTIYKLFTSTLSSILSAYGEQYQILHNSQEGFRFNIAPHVNYNFSLPLLKMPNLQIKIFIYFILNSKTHSAPLIMLDS